MYIYYYKNDTVLDKMPQGMCFFKGKVAYLSDVKDQESNFGIVEQDVTEQELENLAFLYYDADKNSLYVDEQSRQEYEKDKLREARKQELLAFDRYKTNVLLGIDEDVKVSDEIVLWYRKVLDLDIDAIYNPPARIQYYL